MSGAAAWLNRSFPRSSRTRSTLSPSWATNGSKKKTIGDAFRRGGDLEAAKAALLDAVNGPDGHMNPFIYLRLGQTLVDLGDTERGCEHLLQAYMLESSEIFEDEGEKYLDLSRKSNLVP